MLLLRQYLLTALNRSKKAGPSDATGSADEGDPLERAWAVCLALEDLGSAEALELRGRLLEQMYVVERHIIEQEQAEGAEQEEAVRRTEVERQHLDAVAQLLWGYVGRGQLPS
jgi:hypothetical protein